MSEGLKALLEAAQFIEQQEKLSPQATTAILNEQQQHFIVHAYDATVAAATAASADLTNTTTTPTNVHFTGGSINIRNSNIRHGNTGSLQVSSSAPAAAAAFQHFKGHHSNKSSSSNTTASSVHPVTQSTTKVLTIGTNNSSSATLSTSASGHQQHPQHHLHHHPHLNLNQQPSSQLLNANHHDYEFSGNSNSSGLKVVASSASSAGPTSGNLLQQSPINCRSSEGRIMANSHHQLHVQNRNNNNNSNSNNNNNNNNSTSMMVDEIPPTHPSFITNSSSPLGQSAGNHYMHMINTAGSQQAGVIASGSGHVTHVTPRRRTISSTSNCAGTREVHNKLEKNRRAHLKECYEALKNQLSLKDEDRRKTSNLAILGEALKCVQTFQKRNQELEAEWEHLANDKINLQKRIVSLKRELGPKYEQIFSGIFSDIEVGGIPSEREIINDVHSLSSGRGSTLYSSSSSLSSGGSNGSNSSSSGGSGSNTMSSPVGAGLQTAMPTISPVINKINNSNSNNNNNINSTSPISINSNSNIVIQQQHQRKNPSISTTTTIQAVAIPAHGGSGGGGTSSPPAGSPTALITFGSSLPLSLTAKNISATAITRGSPTPSTPSPSPSSSSGVSSSSSLISSSPPINGVISNGRNVAVNIPNGLKLQAAAVTGAGLNGNGSGVISSNAASTSGAQGVNNTNNVLGNQQPQQQNGRKKNLTLPNNNNNSINSNTFEPKNNHQHQHATEDGEQPAKFLKVFNTTTTETNGHHQNDAKTHATQKLLLASNGGILQGVVGGGGGGGSSGSGSGVVYGGNNGGSITATSAVINKSVNNSSASYAVTPATITSTNELCRLPGGAELNILPSNGLKVSSGGAGPVATAFYHANGKITFVNGPSAHHHQNQYQYQHPPSSPLPNSTTTITSNGTTTLTNGFLLKDSTSVTPLLVAAASSPTTPSVNGLHFSGNFAQLLAAANTSATANAIGHSNNGTANGSIVPLTTNFQNLAESKSKNNNKSAIVTWRSGAATTH